MTPLATEFLRRFFLHVLPKGFVRIRLSASQDFGKPNDLRNIRLFENHIA
jgi:hypothetical protein